MTASTIALWYARHAPRYGSFSSAFRFAKASGGSKISRANCIIFLLGNDCERLCAPECMTDEIPPVRQISGNFGKFQGGSGELSHFPPKAAIYRGFGADLKVLNTSHRVPNPLLRAKHISKGKSGCKS